MITTVSQCNIHPWMINILLALELETGFFGGKCIICIMVSHSEEKLAVLITSLVFHCDCLVRVTICITLCQFSMSIATKWLECWRYSKLIVLS